MGLFDFKKDAGKDVEEKDKRTEAQIADDKIQELRNQRFTNNLNKEAKELGLATDNVTIQFDRGTVHVKGTLGSQTDREKLILALGNVKGVEKVKDEITVDQSEQESTMYTVVAGDSLSKIAKHHYGDAMKYMVIFEANQPMLKDPNKIYVGQVLRIPPLND
ncbi:MAG TPA: peptidoglycan-binding protein LysM [Thermoanaerobaculia bacterium]|nr:peptidoglycan-binding protein LysM [Thermoanaerobaculia bacterium]HUM31077.1 peptidoglycan-binding protein LysM [Thermoanaerobaculia bacterium]HXK69411.1 peptidoglycan-binding protein LysM [Thermoanaerobaculia bacterium]